MTKREREEGEKRIVTSVDEAGGHGAGGEAGTGGTPGGIGTFSGGPDEPGEAEEYREKHGENQQ